VRFRFFPTEKKLIDLVLPGLELVRAIFWELISLFIREDFPTFDLPAKAISGLSEGGNCSGIAALFKKETSIGIGYLKPWPRPGMQGLVIDSKLRKYFRNRIIFL